MNKTLATVGLLAVTGALSICDLCGSGTPGSVARVGFVSTAQAAPAGTSRQSLPPDAVPAVSGVAEPTDAVVHAADAQAPASRTVTLAVRGMTCGGCVLATRTTLTRLPGVTKADVSYERGTALVTYDPAKVTVARMIAAIRTLHYTATVVPPAAD